MNIGDIVEDYRRVTVPEQLSGEMQYSLRVPCPGLDASSEIDRVTVSSFDEKTGKLVLKGQNDVLYANNMAAFGVTEEADYDKFLIPLSKDGKSIRLNSELISPAAPYVKVRNDNGVEFFGPFHNSLKLDFASAYLEACYIDSSVETVQGSYLIENKIHKSHVKPGYDLLNKAKRGYGLKQLKN